MEYVNYINDFKKSIQTQISEFSYKVEKYVNDIEQKNKHFQNLQKELSNKESEIDSYNKVSFVKKLDKQLEAQKKDTEVYKLRMRSMQKTINRLQNQNKKLKEGIVEFDYNEFDKIFQNLLKSYKRMNKNKIIEEIKNMFEIIRGTDELNKSLKVEKDRLECIEKKKLLKKKPSIVNSEELAETINNALNNDKISEDSTTLHEKTESVKEETVEETKSVKEETVEETKSVKEETVEETKSVKEETDDIKEVTVETDKPKDKEKIAQILDSIHTFNEKDYNLLLYKNKKYYLDKFCNKIFRRRKSGKIGKEYGLLNNNNLTIEKF